MIRADDIEYAVEAGILTADQAAALQRMAAARRRSRTFALGREERFRLLGGFNDVFVALGVLLLGIALLSLPATVVRTGGLAADRHAMDAAAVYTVGILIFWGLAELLTGRLKLVAPSIVIVVFLALLSAAAGSAVVRGWTVVVLVAPVVLVALHYLRFRLPFSLFALALTGVWLAVTAAAGILETRLGANPSPEVLTWLVLGLGLGVFAWAMAFDTSDPERVSRRADCGFWLHLLAAPLIAHPLAGPLIAHPLFGTFDRTPVPVADTTVVLAVLLITGLSLVALVVDRRALLVAGLGYLGSAMAYAISKWTGVGQGPMVLTILMILGVLVITLGIGWRQIRAALMSRLPGTRWKRRLPPYERPA
jgi:hypothetical protein